MTNENPEADKDKIRNMTLEILNQRYHFVKDNDGKYKLEPTNDPEYPYLDSLLLVFWLSHYKLQPPPQILKDSISRRIDTNKLDKLIQVVLEDKNPVNYSLFDLEMSLVDNDEKCFNTLRYLIGKMAPIEWDYSWYPYQKHKELEELIEKANKMRSAVLEKLGIKSLEELSSL
jgi:hypothetical protein